jgi:hypothetical protein
MWSIVRRSLRGADSLVRAAPVQRYSEYWGSHPSGRLGLVLRAALFTKTKSADKNVRATQFDPDGCELRRSHPLGFHHELLSTPMQLDHLLYFGDHARKSSLHFAT